jgi:arylamine N-acetyltransferase
MSVVSHGHRRPEPTTLTRLALPPVVVDAYLRHLGVPEPTLDVDGLALLQRRHLSRVPFHNLALLACEGTDPGLPDVIEVARANAGGIGGTCHLQTPPFVALLRSLGFDAWLAAADITNPGDHFVGIVRIGGVSYLTDVGNGHPYDRPWPLDAAVHESDCFGWRFRFGPSAGDDGRTHVLMRRLPGAGWDQVYRTSAAPQPLEAFAGIIRDHHALRGFGPFMRALRAVRITERRLLTLRDDRYRRYGGAVPALRLVRSRGALERLMLETFGLPSGLVRRALHVLARDTEWFEDALPRPRVLVATTCSDRPDQLQKLAGSLAVDRDACGWSREDVGMLVLDNGVHPGLVATTELPCRVVRREKGRRSIGESRADLTAELVAYLTGPPGSDLPHPKEGEVIVWMVDDDLTAEELVVEGGVRAVRPHRGLLQRVADLCRAHPEVSVAVGGTNGDPPIPAHDAVRRQAEDLASALEELALLAPEERWAPAANDRSEPDYHYDLTEHGKLGGRFRWETWKLEPTAREVLEEILLEVPRLAGGASPMRALVGRAPVARTRARGGNAVFFDLDALDVAPYPELDLGWGRTRRADMIWGLLVSSYPEFGLFTAPVPLLHARRVGDGSSPLAARTVSTDALAHFIVQQAVGVVVCRLMERDVPPDGDAVRSLLRSRLDRTRANILGASDALRRAAAVLRSSAWWSGDPRVERAAGELDVFVKSLDLPSTVWPSINEDAVLGFARRLWELRGPARHGASSRQGSS